MHKRCKMSLERLPIRKWESVFDVHGDTDSDPDPDPKKKQPAVGKGGRSKHPKKKIADLKSISMCLLFIDFMAVCVDSFCK